MKTRVKSKCMWSTGDVEEFEAHEDYCSCCGERDLVDAMVSVVVATKEWPYSERYVHPECRDMFVAANLPAVLASIRGATL